ncbi:HK97 family phage prohead protease [Leifsonia sp. WHRI 6310E]|uniref:HK97 family phage prohead protease n=1 Tax=Leifsonia sp. WHRI 6310E TaxID=3162562 RepID=UPI0032EDDC80
MKVKKNHVSDRIKIAAFDITVPDDAAEGEFTALVAAYGNVDSQGDIIEKGAFADTLAEWATKGDPIPVIFNHDWDNAFAHIGAIQPENAVETDQGLQVTGTIDIDEPYAGKVYRLMKQRRLTQFSFIAMASEGGWSLETREDGSIVSRLTKLDLYEVGPTLRGANAETQLISIKSATAVLDAIDPSSFADTDLDSLKAIHKHIGDAIALADSNDSDADDANVGTAEEPEASSNEELITAKALLALSTMKKGS